MSDDYLPLLLAQMQQEISSLREQVANLTARVDEIGQAIDDDSEAPSTYMDGTPI